LAKLKGPLFSLGAAGQVGKTLVYFAWKGLDVVREWVKPSNPQTAAQTTQRGYMTAAVELVHDAQAHATHPLLEVDQIAYAALAAAKGKVMTWFNMAVKLCVDVLVADDSPVIYKNVDFSDKTVASFDMSLQLEEETGSDLAAGKFYFGISKTNLIHAVTANVTAGVNVNLAAEDISAWATAGIKYFVQFRPDVGDPSVGADSGIYYFVAE